MKKEHQIHKLASVLQIEKFARVPSAGCGEFLDRHTGLLRKRRGRPFVAESGRWVRRAFSIISQG